MPIKAFEERNPKLKLEKAKIRQRTGNFVSVGHLPPLIDTYEVNHTYFFFFGFFFSDFFDI
jgi:hypothetical protein